MRKLRHLGSSLLVLGALSLGAATLAGPAAAVTPVYNASLKAVHVGSTNPGFSEGECPSEGWGWHFILPGNTSEFVFVKATFQNEGVVTAFVSAPTGKHAYVYTSGPDTLLAAEAQVTGTEDEFVLSHVCTGPAVTTTVPEETTTVPEETTTVPEETTTVPEETTTVPEETTTVPEETTTVPEETTTVPEETTTVPEETTTTEGPEVLPTSTIVGETTTTEPTEVISESTTTLATTTTTGPVVASNSALPRTGSNSKTLVTTGMALVLFGGVLLLRSRRLDRV